MAKKRAKKKKGISGIGEIDFMSIASRGLGAAAGGAVPQLALGYIMPNQSNMVKGGIQLLVGGLMIGMSEAGGFIDAAGLGAIGAGSDRMGQHFGIIPAPGVAGIGADDETDLEIDTDFEMSGVDGDGTVSGDGEGTVGAV